ncbi:MAG: hypothetical protein JNM86_08115 [Phycisphaerae bacterium]|nr:hypothetical protein [Phycisphaerae bacterium]
MSQSLPPNFDGDQASFQPEAIDRYLDGLMSGTERAAFEQAIGGSEALQEAIALQNRLDASLRSEFGAPPAPAGLLTREEARAFSEKKQSTGWSRERRMFLALAALVALVASIQGFFWLSASSNSAERPSLAHIYQGLVDHGFRPSEECTTNEKFAGWMKAKFGVALALKEVRPDVQLVGWSSSTAISNYTGLLLATVDGQPVMVAIDTVARQNEWGFPCRRQPGEDAAVNFFSAEIDGIAVYEVTPLDKPRIIDNLAVFKAGQ